MKFIKVMFAAAVILLQVSCTSQEEQDYHEKRQQQKAALVHVALPTWTINFKLTHKETGKEFYQYAVLKAKDEEAAKKLLTDALGTSPDISFEILNIELGRVINTNTR